MGGKRASLQLLDKKATPAYKGVSAIALFTSSYPPIKSDSISLQDASHLFALRIILLNSFPISPSSSSILNPQSTTRAQIIPKGDGRQTTHSEERNSDDDAPVLGARQLVDGVAHVAVVLLGGAAEAGAGGDSFGGHCFMFVCVCVCVLVGDG
jgi:hypothetical protein